MKQRIHRGLVWLVMALSGASLFQVFPVTGTNGAGFGCQQFATNGVLSSVDFCYIFDCQSGFLGGVVQPCGDPTVATDDLLVDCTPGGLVVDDQTR